LGLDTEKKKEERKQKEREEKVHCIICHAHYTLLRFSYNYPLTRSCLLLRRRQPERKNSPETASGGSWGPQARWFRSLML
jgi:hypothetical protein